MRRALPPRLRQADVKAALDFMSPDPQGVDHTHVVAIDPGYTRSAVVVLEDERPVYALLEDNDFVLSWLHSTVLVGPLVIEQIQSYGMAAGKTLFETCVWSGRFWQVWADRGMAVHQLPRREVKLHLCGQSRAKDPNVRQALIDRFGPGKEAAIGLKNSPGPLYGFKSDMWAALAVAVTWRDQEVTGERR